MENLMLEIISEGNISSKIPDHKDSKLVEYAKRRNSNRGN
jgi:hypothetical protein